MKLQRILFAIIVSVLLGCSKKSEEIIIHGKVNGNLKEKVEYTTPDDGKWFYGDKKSITVDSTGSFQIKMDIDAPSFITLYVPSKGSGGVLLVEPGSTYDVNFEFETKNKTFVVTSNNGTGQNLLNSFSLPDFYMSEVMSFLSDSIPSVTSSKIDSLKKKVISEFDSLLNEEKISKGFYELAVLDRKCYYLALKATIATFYLNSYKGNEPLKKARIKDFWSETLNLSSLNESNYIRSPWFYALAANIMVFNQYSSDDFDPKELTKVYEAGNIHHYNIEKAKEHLSGEELEYYLASYIFLYSWNNEDNSKELIEIYENFKKEYPNSSYTAYLATPIKPIIDFHNKLAESTTDEKIKFVQNYKNVNTFEELIKTFKGKKVFIDIWGTWCSPCKKEFQYKADLIKLLKSRDIESLYICEGKHSKENVWKEMIKFYDLEGHHIRANQNLLSDIIDRFGKNGDFAYPRYLLVDENGNAVNEQASYPSKLKELENEINENYVW